MSKPSLCKVAFAVLLWGAAGGRGSSAGARDSPPISISSSPGAPLAVGVSQEDWAGAFDALAKVPLDFSLGSKKLAAETSPAGLGGALKGSFEGVKRF